MEESGGRDEVSFFMFKGVFTKVMVYLLVFSIRRANASKGMIWP